MLVYDMMISIDKEVEVVWSRRPSLVTVVHVLNRYMEILAYLAALILLLPVSDQVSVLKLITLRCLVNIVHV